MYMHNISLLLFAFSILALLITSQPASALTLSWSGTGTSGTDPLGHTWLKKADFNWGIPGRGEGILPFNGNDWVTDFHFTVNNFPPQCGFELTSSTVFLVQDATTDIEWDQTVMGNTIWFVAADPVTDRLDPNEEFFVNIAFTCDIPSIDFDALWSMDVNGDDEVVGGSLLPIDSTALVLAGAQSFSWMIPVVLSVLGIGLFVVSRKSE